MHWIVLSLIIVGFVIAAPVTAVVRGVSRRLGHLDSAGSAGHVKMEIRSVPNTGGVGIFAALAVPMLVGLVVLNVIDATTVPDQLDALRPHLKGVRDQTPMALAILGCLVVLHVVGLVDDRRAIGAGLKLSIEFGAAFIVVYFFDSRLLTLLDAAPALEALAPWPSVIASVLWIVVMTNAVNMLDNMDGLAGGVTAIASALFLTAALLNGQWFIGAMLSLLLGALIGFLLFNFPPASIFMGDGGSLIVGFLLGFLTVRTTYFGASADTSWYGVFMPIIVLAVPLYDFLSVVTIRLKQGRKPWVGDQQHFSHRLVQRGLSKRTAVLVIYGVTLATGLGGVILARVEPWQAALIGAQTLVILGVLALYEHAAFRGARTLREPVVNDDPRTLNRPEARP